MTNTQKIFIATLITLIGIFTVLSINVFRTGKPATSSVHTPTTDLPLVATTSIVTLRDGDTYTLTASMVKKVIAGTEVRMLAYNGSIPGPTIKVTQGSTITIHFVNDIDAPSTIHSHGIRLDNAFDGVPGVTQKEVRTGESFDYTITFPDAGIFWYHPHIDEPYEQSLGLYGNFIVTPSDANYWAPVHREIPITLGDLLVGQDGTPVPYTMGRTDHTLMGRYGNLLLTSGVEHLALVGTKGEVLRLYLTNVASARPFQFAIKGAKVKLVGADNGRYERETFVDSVILGPSERAIVDVLLSEPGVLTLQNATPLRTYELGTITVTDGSVTPSYTKAFQTLRKNIDTIAEFTSLAPYQSSPPDKTISLTIDMPGMGGGSMMGGMHRMPDGTMMNANGMTMGSDDSKIEWEDTMSMMSAMSDQDSVKWKIVDTTTGMANMDVNWQFKVGDKVKIRITNDPKSVHPMQHPIHFHGQRFFVLSTNGVPNDNMAWKDTTLIGKGDTVDILLDVTNPGEWMAHCHISEHLADGMMIGFTVSK